MRRRLALGIAGAAATAVAAIAIVRPGLVLGFGPVSALVSLLSEVGTRDLLLAGGLAVGSYVFWVVRSDADEGTLSGAGQTDRFERALVDRPEAVTVGGRTLTAAATDGQFAAAADGDDVALERARERLADLAAARFDTVDGPTAPDGPAASERPADPEDAIAAGTWTDDRTAAAFLAADDRASYPLLARVRLWLDPRAERERRLRRTVAAIESLEGER